MRVGRKMATITLFHLPFGAGFVETEIIAENSMFPVP
jgi:hypothetical protein